MSENEHRCLHEKDFIDLFETVRSTSSNVKLITQSIVGNGVKGLHARVEDLEKSSIATIKENAKLTALAAIIASITTVIIKML